MDPVTAGLISAGGSILGGIFGKPKNEYVVPNYQKIRTKAEAAGFNPLTALAMAPGQVVQSQNFMGSAIADAGLALADGLNTKRKEQGALAKLAEENDKLREKVQNMTLRPKVPGVYAQREAIPSVSQAVGGSNAKANATGTVGGSGAAVASGLGVDPSGGPLPGEPGYSIDRNVTSPPLRAFGIDWYKSDKTSNAQGFQNSLGEGWISETVAPIMLGADYLGTTAGMWTQRLLRKSQADAWRRDAQRHHNADWQRY